MCIYFKETTTGYVGLINNIAMWFIREDKELNKGRPENEIYNVYKSEDGDFEGIVGFETIEDAKTFIYKEELT